MDVLYSFLQQSVLFISLARSAYLEVDVDHDGGGRPEGDDAGEDGKVLVHHEVAAVLAVLPDELKKGKSGVDQKFA